MNLTGHVAVWLTAIALVGLASPLVRAYAAHLERRTRSRAEAVARRVLGERREPDVPDDQDPDDLVRVTT